MEEPLCFVYVFLSSNTFHVEDLAQFLQPNQQVSTLFMLSWYSKNRKPGFRLKNLVLLPESRTTPVQNPYKSSAKPVFFVCFFETRVFLKTRLCFGARFLVGSWSSRLVYAKMSRLVKRRRRRANECGARGSEDHVFSNPHAIFSNFTSWFWGQGANWKSTSRVFHA